MSPWNRWTSTLSWVGLAAFAWFFFLPAFAPDLQSLLLAWVPFDPLHQGGDGAPIVSSATRLRWLLSLLPAGIILQHALFLRFLRVRQFPTTGSRSLTPNADPRLLVPTAVARDLHFGTSYLALRYCFPALMAAALCSTVLSALQDPAQYVAAGVLKWPEWPAMLRGFQFGFAGAYVYVVITLAQRTFRSDVTTGVAMWSAAMFVLGPSLAAAVAFVWPDNTAQAGTDSLGGFTKDIVLIASGIAPRQFSAFLQRQATRFTQSATPAVSRRIIPLSEIRGINDDIELRLAEEGIVDTFTLAYCDPWLLMRSTSFDRRQIAAWVDEALLVINLEKYRGLEANGITGAMDLAWYAWSARDLEPLAKAAGIEIALLQQTAARLAEDAQVLQVWTLYQIDSESEPDPAQHDRKSGAVSDDHTRVLTDIGGALRDEGDASGGLSAASELQAGHTHP